MKRIEDIRPGKRRTTRKPEPEIFEPNFSAPEFYAEAPSLPVPEPEAPNYKQRLPINRRKTRANWLSFGVILIIVLAFCGFELIEIKTKISDNIKSLNTNFSALTDAMSKKDFAALGNQIKILNQKTSDSVIDLQSVGQDIYVLNLLYPKGKSSKISGEIDTLRGAQMLVNSFDQILSVNDLSSSASMGSDYLSKINNYLDGFNQIIGAAPTKIKNAKFYSRQAKSLNDSISSDGFSASEQQSVENLQKFSSTAVDFFDYMEKVPAEISDALSISSGKKSYLILFQNNTEIRPAGGFLGSFARLDLVNGHATALDFETNIYTLDKAFIAAGNHIAPPAEYSSLSTNWTMRDSNVYPDFATSAEKVAWFYQQESALPAAKEIAGVISIDTTLFRNLLKVVGPINMPEYNLVVTDQNFLSDVQYQVEIGYFQDNKNKAENEPKKILADMMPKFMAAMTKNNQVEESVGKELMRAIPEKHLMVYSANSLIEDLVDGIGMSGKIHQVSGDYLYLSDANIGGLKSSLNIAETVSQNIEINQAGGVKESLIIQRKHNGDGSWPDGENINYLTAMLPLSSVIDSKDIKSSVISGKNAVSYWQNTKPGDTSQSTINYHRDNAVNLSGDNFEYQITIQKQPGVESFDWRLYLVYPQGWRPQNVEGYDAKNRQIYLSQTISKDSVFRLRFIRD